MGHGNSDRLYITHEELSGTLGNHTAAGGQRRKASDQALERLPFDCCALSLQPWINPVCNPCTGTVFELTNVIPFLKKHGIDPATGDKLDSKDLIRLNFSRNANGNVHDPISYKVFNEHSHIVALRSTGNVFLHETIHRLNIKAKYMRDLIDDTPFTKTDIITLQDPHNFDGKQISDLHHVKAHLSVPSSGDEIAGKSGDVEGAEKASNGLRKQVSLQKSATSPQQSEASTSKKPDAGSLSSTKASRATPASKLPYNASAASTGMMAASFTSSALNVRTKSERQLINEEEYMFEQVAAGHAGVTKGKKRGRGARGFVRVRSALSRRREPLSRRLKSAICPSLLQIETTLGPLNLELLVARAPKTCYNFLELCKKGYYNDTFFHRLIPGFMIQGGDPTGTGRGGSSIWEAPFRDEIDSSSSPRHTHRGTLSMANKGPDTNGSQFFISFRKLPHLDSKHTMFGQLCDDAGGGAGNDDQSDARANSTESFVTLDKLESIPVEIGTDRPLRKINIVATYVLENPFDAWKENLQQRLDRENLSAEQLDEREKKRLRREADRTTWLGTSLEARDTQKTDASKTHTYDDNPAGVKSPVDRVVGKFLQQKKKEHAVASSPFPHTSSSAQRNDSPKAAHAAGADGFGDFSSW